MRWGVSVVFQIDGPREGHGDRGATVESAGAPLDRKPFDVYDCPRHAVLWRGFVMIAVLHAFV